MRWTTDLLDGPLPCSWLAAALLASLGLAGCSSAETAPAAAASGPPCAEPRFATGRLSAQCGQLVDAEGRVVFLHGVNARVEGIFDVTFDDGRTALEPIPALTADDAAEMRAMGFSALRLPIQWSALEPTEDGGFDEAYLDRIKSAVDLLSAAGVRVLLDMHQDAYSKEIGEDGAPLWAIVPAPPELLEGPLTDLDARRKSGPVAAAFSTFFGGSAEGERLRGRFADAAAHVAERFAGDDAVLGIEAFNEPLSGPEHLDALHDLVIAKVHARDPGRLVLFEPDALRNVFDHAGLATRDPWPGTAYAPHVYTLAFTGSPAQREAMTKETLEPSNASAREEAESWKAPLVITEFGYAPDGVHGDDYLAWQGELQDRYQASSFYWVWKEQSQGSWGLFDLDEATGEWTVRAHLRTALARVKPEAVAGWPVRYGYDRAARRFELVFTGDAAIVGPSRIHVPRAEDFAASYDVTCDGAAVTATRDEATGVIEVACGGPGEHSIVVAGR